MVRYEEQGMKHRKAIAGATAVIAIVLVTFGVFWQLNEGVDEETTKQEDYSYEINFRTSLEVREMLITENFSERTEPLSHVVIHFMSNVVRDRRNPFDMIAIRQLFLDYTVSAHYVIDREGNIYLFVPEYRVAWHAGRGSLESFPHLDNRLNFYSIGIELLGIGTREEMAIFMSGRDYDQINPLHIGFTGAQYKALNNLLNDILERHPGILPNRQHIVGHSDYSPNRTDPGSLFDWTRLDFTNS